MDGGGRRDAISRSFREAGWMAALDAVGSVDVLHGWAMRSMSG